MVTAIWVSAGVVFLLHAILLKLAVRFLAKGADNGWDNAFSYTLFTGLLGIPLRWAIGDGGWLLIGLMPLICFGAQTFALKLIYELKPLRAWLLGTAHAILTSLVVGGLTFVAGMVAAYILYGRIIADPLMIVRMILAWLGIELPFPI